MPMADAVEALLPPECGEGESGRSSPSPAASPEFEFWMMGRNPSSFPSAALLTADELFAGGVVLPLHTLQTSPANGDNSNGAENAAAAAEEDSAQPAEVEAQQQQPLAESGIAPTPDLPAVTFKWKDIFKTGAGGGETKERKKAERRVTSVSGNAELININIWPFSRSRSAGHSAGASGTLSRANNNKPTNPTSGASANGTAGVASASAPPASASAPAPTPRKVSSAPCSRSNSRGESGPEPAIPVAATIPAALAAAASGQAAPSPGPTSMLRRLVPGHGRNTTGAGGAAAPGIRLGRPSPVWQLRRNKLQQTAAEQQKQAGAKKNKAAQAPDGTTTTTTDKEEEGKNAAAAAPPTVGAPAAAACRNNAGCSEGTGEDGPNPTQQGLFGLRTFFSKKVY